MLQRRRKKEEEIMLKYYNKMVQQFNNFFNGLKNVKLFLFFNKNRTKEFKHRLPVLIRKVNKIAI